METDEIGKRAKELDSKEMIYRIRIGNKTIVRIILAVIIWMCFMFILNKMI